MSLNYGLTKDFTLIQVTFGISNAIALRLEQGKFYCVTKAKQNTAWKWKLNLLTSNKFHGPVNINFECWYVFFINSNNFRRSFRRNIFHNTDSFYSHPVQ